MKHLALSIMVVLLAACAAIQEPTTTAPARNCPEPLVTAPVPWRDEAIYIQRRDEFLRWARERNAWLADYWQRNAREDRERMVMHFVEQHDEHPPSERYAIHRATVRDRQGLIRENVELSSLVVDALLNLDELVERTYQVRGNAYCEDEVMIYPFYGFPVTGYRGAADSEYDRVRCYAHDGHRLFAVMLMRGWDRVSRYRAETAYGRKSELSPEVLQFLRTGRSP